MEPKKYFPFGGITPVDASECPTKSSMDTPNKSANEIHFVISGMLHPFPSLQ